MGKINNNRMGVNQKPNSSFVIPSNKQNGLDSQADADPVMAKTTIITVSWKLETIPHRSLKLAIC